jgi:hypothetical protein
MLQVFVQFGPPPTTAPGQADQLTQIITLLEKLMTAMTDLQAAVAAEDTVIASAITLLNGLAAQLAAAGTDQAALTALHNDIVTQTAALANAVTANTPAAPPAP